MGWAGGSNVAIPMIEIIQANVESEETRTVLYQGLYDVLRGADWDTVDEATGIDPLFDSIAGFSSDDDDDDFDENDEDDLDDEDGEEP